jgi:hypothetical protein
MEGRNSYIAFAQGNFITLLTLTHDQLDKDDGKHIKTSLQLRIPDCDMLFEMPKFTKQI